MATRTIRSKVLDFLSMRTVKHGESVEYGWFIFQTVVENGQLDLETLDFRAMASFTRDLGPVERIDAEQSAVLAKQGVEPECCALWHAALISRSYTPGAPGAFMERLDPLEDNKSGWYIGVTDDPLDVNEPANLHFQSLYELTIHDARFAPYWLLPVGFRVKFDGDRPAIGDAQMSRDLQLVDSCGPSRHVPSRRLFDFFIPASRPASSSPCGTPPRPSKDRTRKKPN